jgi:hypothetical protein
MTDKDKLIEIYERTIYEITELGLTININLFNSEIDEVVGKYNRISWAFITAANPFSKSVSETENEQYFERLKEQVENNYIKSFLGYGKGQNGWNDEKSLFIIGISETPATELGKLFRQNAIVIGSIGSTAKIKWVRA